MNTIESTTAVRLRNVTKTYDNAVRALQDVSLEVLRGEVVAIIGPSGCGKSTLLRTINGLEKIDSGSIEINGTTVSSEKVRWEEVRQDVGMVFQSYDLFGHLSVLDNLMLAPRVVRGKDRALVREQALALLARVGLADRADSYPRQLSGGQKQRVAIVRALMMDPHVLLLDEVTASLDPEMVREVLDVIIDLAHDGMTMLLVTHEMAFARAIADRVIFMDHGRIKEVARAEKFFTDPGSQRARQFLDTFIFQGKNPPKS
ncbi:amino acid ABC transporter ATP-binding protein [Arcanobacterium pinnipediorum]|uniref:Amino acid ABC transporter ATP-binding protein n=1 Tax=Arcanobacterium pinnipediorum TaxID=1503041 RepID=A0ABY5AF15_9ACTO|nr:amino acid ABC transporter ATP-binding protein [Arcanobacterium pinnipediorum]USR78804.1 amino acid ABC transporter ATP-binding protein [Arcanobacterium pinnipediorum]